MDTSVRERENTNSSAWYEMLFGLSRQSLNGTNWAETRYARLSYLPILIHDHVASGSLLDR